MDRIWIFDDEIITLPRPFNFLIACSGIIFTAAGRQNNLILFLWLSQEHWYFFYQLKEGFFHVQPEYGLPIFW